MKKKIGLRILAGVGGFGIIAGLVFFACALLGNPVSHSLVKKSAEKYIKENYGGTDYFIESIKYSFKTGGYTVQVKSPSSVDTHFSLNADLRGRIGYNSYDSYVEGRFNTWSRIDSEYRSLADKVLDAPDFPYFREKDFGCGTIEDMGDTEAGRPPRTYGIIRKELELDKEYDAAELGKEAGHIILYITDDTASPQRAAQILLDIRKRFDAAGVGFYAVDLNLRSEGDKESLWLEDFLYGDIYEKGLEERIRESMR